MRSPRRSRRSSRRRKKVDDAVLKVVRRVFKETAPVRFEGNNYSEEWVKEAAKRGLPNLRRTPEALAQLVDEAVARSCSRRSASLSDEELRLALPRAARALRQGHAHRAAHAARDGRHDRPAGGARVLGRRRRVGGAARRRPGIKTDSAGRGGERARHVDRRAPEAPRRARAR